MPVSAHTLVVFLHCCFNTLLVHPELAFIYMYITYQQFLAQWVALPELQTAGRRTLLQSLQRVYELEEYLIDNEHNLLHKYRAEGLIKLWREHHPSPQLDDVNVWENIVEQRATLEREIQQARRHRGMTIMHLGVGGQISPAVAQCQGQEAGL